ncbi:MAG TPA: FAD-binding protein [Candidatus Saccharibacteria bacterium]|nr:FAD-binding protein [Candidatus Saccharibacteria bacterium]
MKILHNELLAPYTSLRVGGPAERLVIAENYEEAVSLLRENPTPLWLLGYGCNSLINDTGLTGTTLMLRGGAIVVNGNEVIADAGTWWDDAVQASLQHNLWGLELLSGIPSSTGGAIFGNIAAYGAQISDTLQWIEVYDTRAQTVIRRSASDITFSYRNSSLQAEPNIVILRAAFALSAKVPVHEFKYESALSVANELGVDTNQLAGRRAAILETRSRAGSLYDPADPTPERTAGSFFKNPLVELEQAKKLAAFDETGKTLERILEQSQIHGGSSQRASAAHVLLAAGFHRGQRWEHVQLHPSHVLKLSTLPGATSSEVMAVVREIQDTVKEKLSIEIEPEVKFIG